jgi:hypothetical protein
MFGFSKIIVIALSALTAVQASVVPEVADVEKRQSMLLQYFNSGKKIVTTVFSVGSVINQITSGAASVATHDGIILFF